MIRSRRMCYPRRMDREQKRETKWRHGVTSTPKALIPPLRRFARARETSIQNSKNTKTLNGRISRPGSLRTHHLPKTGIASKSLSELEILLNQYRVIDIKRSEAIRKPRNGDYISSLLKVLGKFETPDDLPQVGKYTYLGYGLKVIPDPTPITTWPATYSGKQEPTGVHSSVDKAHEFTDGTQVHQRSGQRNCEPWLSRLNFYQELTDLEGEAKSSGLQGTLISELPSYVIDHWSFSDFRIPTQRALLYPATSEKNSEENLIERKGRCVEKTPKEEIQNSKENTPEHHLKKAVQKVPSWSDVVKRGLAFSNHATSEFSSSQCGKGHVILGDLEEDRFAQFELEPPGILKLVIEFEQMRTCQKYGIPYSKNFRCYKPSFTGKL